jgi:multisubunit Na+/H+ antiporter MnhB subunit
MSTRRVIAFDLAAVVFALAANGADAAGVGLLAWLTLMPAALVFVIADRRLKQP